MNLFITAVLPYIFRKVRVVVFGGDEETAPPLFRKGLLARTPSILNVSYNVKIIMIGGDIVVEPYDFEAERSVSVMDQDFIVHRCLWRRI